MPFASKNVVRAWLFIAIISITVLSVFGSEDKRIDLKIGFDLTQGANGGPSLRLRDFEDSPEFNPRANDDDKGSKSSANSNESVKSSEKKERKHVSSRESDSSKDSEDNYSSDESRKYSTRGMKAEDEPEGQNVNKYDIESDNDNDSASENRLRHREKYAESRRT